MSWTLAAILALLGAWIAYGPLWRAASTERGSLAADLSRPAAPKGVASVLLGVLRFGAYFVLLAMLFGASAGRPAPLPPLAVLDVSQSHTRANDGSLWRRALDSLAATAGDSVLLSGDSARVVARADAVSAAPNDRASRLQPALDAATALGRSVTVITDGELDDPTALLQLPAGSRVVRLDRETHVDLALANLEVPTFATGGDTIDVHATLTAGNDTVRGASLAVRLAGEELARVSVQSLDPFASRRITLRVPLPRGAGERALVVALNATSDIEPRNDSLVAALDISDRPRVVFVTTAPDLDVREVLRVMRGSVMLPTRAYLRVAPGLWREEGTLAPISEALVQLRAREAGLLVLHGDTTWNDVASQRRGATITWKSAPPPAAPRAGEISRPAEWFVFRAPVSPLSSMLSGLPFDSLPPLEVGGAVDGGVPILEARVGRSGDARAIAAVSTASGPRRLRISGSGFASWALREGRASDAFTALWGAIFDWMAASEGDANAASLVGNLIRAGEPLRWRRGGADSAAFVVITAADGARDTVRLQFGAQSDIATSNALASGVYSLQTGDVSRALIVNPSRELVPRAPAAVPSIRAAGDVTLAPRSLLERTWPIVVALVLLSAEWLLRRRVGLR